MTMAFERTRAMRWMWEFLYVNKDAQNIKEPDRQKLQAVFRHFPSYADVKRWATLEQVKPGFLVFLAPEDPELLKRQDKGIPDFVDRGPSTAIEIAQAIEESYDLLRFGNIEWNTEQRNQIEYVLRHFPSCEGSDLVKVRQIENWKLTNENQSPGI